MPAQQTTKTSGEASMADENGWALCMSGGGYRAMLFHVGALWRLTELGYLPRLRCVSSVSGGSITAGVLALKWHRLVPHTNTTMSAFVKDIVTPIRKLASRTLDLPALIRSWLWFPRSAPRIVQLAYGRHLYGRATLQEVPEHPSFVLNATSLQTGE